MRIYGFDRNSEQRDLGSGTSEDIEMREQLGLVPKRDDPFPTLVGEYVKIDLGSAFYCGRYLGTTHHGNLALDNFLRIKYDHANNSNGDVVGAEVVEQVAYFARPLAIGPFSRDSLDKLVSQINSRRQ